MKRLALFGTRYTMQADFYQRVFRREGIELVVPESKDQDYIHEKYMGEWLKGIILAETRAGLLEIVNRLKREEQIQGVILAGTELPLILRVGLENPRYWASWLRGGASLVFRRTRRDYAR